MAAPVTLLYGGLCGLLLFVLVALVVWGRGKYKVSLGDGGNENMLRLLRAQGNFIEYVPLTLFLVFLLEISGRASPTWLHAFGAALVVGRIAHAWGIIAVNPGRTVGITLNWLVLLAVSVWLILIAL